MHPPPRVQLDFESSLLLLLAGDVSLNPGPVFRGLCLGTVDARSMQDEAPALSDLVASKSIDLFGISETWLTTKETFVDLADTAPKVFSFFHKPRTWRRRGGVGLFMPSVHKFTAISLPTQTSFEGISGKLKCGQSWLIILNIYHPPGPTTGFFSTRHTSTLSDNGKRHGLGLRDGVLFPAPHTAHLLRWAIAHVMHVAEPASQHSLHWQRRRCMLWEPAHSMHGSIGDLFLPSNA